MADQTTFKCPCCSAQLTYEPNEKFVCKACENEFDVETMNRISNINENDSDFDWEGYKKEFEENAENLECSVYVCASCGAQIETGETEVTAHCPYCGSEIVLSDKLSGGLKPNLIIPFKIDKNSAMEAVKKHFADKKLLPGSFYKEHTLSKLQGIYVPFWLFDAKVDGTVYYNAETIYTYTSGDYDCVDTKHYLVEAEGAVSFAKIPVDASLKVDNDLMDALEPFDYKKLEQFNQAYLAGHLADRFDEGPDESIDRATVRFKNSVAEIFKNKACKDYDTATMRGCDLRLENPSVKYALLPVYLLNVEYRSKKYRFAVNGQTGKVVGELPIGFWKRIKAIATGAVIGGGITAAAFYVGVKLLYLIF